MNTLGCATDGREGGFSSCGVGFNGFGASGCVVVRKECRYEGLGFGLQS